MSAEDIGRYVFSNGSKLHASTEYAVPGTDMTAHAWYKTCSVITATDYGSRIIQIGRFAGVDVLGKNDFATAAVS